MKKILLATLSIILISGCASSSIIKPLQTNYQSSEKIGIVKFAAEHFGKASEGYTMSPIVSAIAYYAEEGDGGEDYLKELDNEVFITIETELGRDNSISYSETSDPSILTQNSIEQSVLAKYASEHDLAYLLSVNVRYSSSSGFSKPLLLTVTWSVFNELGVKIGEIETVEVTKDGYGAFPNTRERRFKEPYLSLVKPIVVQFISFLNKGGKFSV